MIAIDNVLISDDIIQEKFMCQLNACKGACCYEGDLGAPVQKEEVEILNKVYPIIKHKLPEENQNIIESQGTSKYYKDLQGMGTTLINGGPCVFMTKDDLGIAKCAIEQAYYEGLVNFKKPISCHLYPIRLVENPKQGFVAMNYDRWDICAPACQAGQKEKIPVYQFVREAIERRFGTEFYEALDHAAQNPM